MLGFAFFHPPLKAILQVLRLAEESGTQGLLIVPDWPGSFFSPHISQLESRGQLQLVRRFRPTLESAPWIKSTTFAGVPKFDFCAYKMDF